LRSAEVQRAERAWLTRELTGGRTGLDAAWVALMLGEITRLRRLSERLLMIAAAEDPGFLRTEPVLLDEFVVELIGRWRPTAAREWKLGRLDAATVLADAERLGLATDALLENAIRHTRDGEFEIALPASTA